MFTIKQIHEAFGKVRSGADFPQYVSYLDKKGNKLLVEPIPEA